MFVNEGVSKHEQMPRASSKKTKKEVMTYALCSAQKLRKGLLIWRSCAIPLVFFCLTYLYRSRKLRVEPLLGGADLSHGSTMGEFT